MFNSLFSPAAPKQPEAPKEDTRNRHQRRADAWREAHSETAMRKFWEGQKKRAHREHVAARVKRQQAKAHARALARKEAAKAAKQNAKN